MVKTGRARTRRLVSLCALLVSGSLAAVSAAGASAGPLEGVTGPVEEAVAPPVGEVAERVPQPVQEITETAAPPVHEVTETTGPPAKEVTPTVTQPVNEAVKPAAKQAAETVASSPATAPVKGAAASAVNSATNTPGTSSGAAAKSAGTAAREATGAATHRIQGTVGAVTRVVHPGLPSSGGGDTAGAYGGRAADGVAPREAGRPNHAWGPGGVTYEVPSPDGAVRAPLAKWLAYVWPAIALIGPAATNFIDRWELRSVRLAAEGDTAGGRGSGERPVVAGAHASGGRAGAPDSSSSPFSKITSAIDYFPSNAPGAVLGYLLILAVMLIGFFVAMRWASEGRGK